MAYPIATMADGTILYSDGTKKSSPQYSPTEGHGSYNDGYAFNASSNTWSPVDTSYENKIPGSGYTSDYQNQGSREPLRSEQVLGNGNSNTSGSIRTEYNGRWYDSQSDARAAQEADQRAAQEAQQRAAQEYQQGRTNEMSKFNNFLGQLIKPTSQAYAGNGSEQSSPYAAGAFGDILRSMGINKDRGISEMFGGNMKSLEAQGSSLPLWQQGIRGANMALPSTIGAREVDWLGGQLTNRFLNDSSSGSSSSASGSYSTNTPTNYFANAPADQYQSKMPDVLGTKDTTVPQTSNFQDYVNDSGIFGIWDEGGTGVSDPANPGENGVADYIVDQQSNLAEQLQAQSDKIMVDYDKMTADEKAAADYQLSEIQSQLDLLKDQGTAAKESIANAYGDLIRKGTKGKSLSEQKLRNMFSALGTSESSAFMEQMMANEQDFGRNVNLTEREMLSKQAEIDRGLRGSQEWADRETNSVNSKLKAFLDQIKAAKYLKEGEADAYANQLNREAIEQLASVGRTYAQGTAQNARDLNAYKAQIAAAMIPSYQIEQQANALNNPMYGNSNGGYQGYVPPGNSSGMEANIHNLFKQMLSDPQYRAMLGLG